MGGISVRLATEQPAIVFALSPARRTNFIFSETFISLHVDVKKKLSSGNAEPYER